MFLLHGRSTLTARAIRRAQNSPQGRMSRSPNRKASRLLRRKGTIRLSSRIPMDTTRFSLLFRIKNPANQAAWGEFDAIYRPMLTRFVRMKGLSGADADDIVQQCMMAVHKHIGGFEYDPQKGRFKGWLRTMVGNRVRNHFRDKREYEGGTGVFSALPDSEHAPDEAFDRVWMEEHLRHCLNQVRAEATPQEYDAYQRYVLDEQSVEDVCAAFSYTAQQLYKIKWRLTQKVSEKMRELLGEDE